MEPPNRSGDDFLGLGVQQDQEEQQNQCLDQMDTKPTAVLPAEERKDGEESVQLEAKQGAAAEEKGEKEELGREGQASAGAPGPLDDKSKSEGNRDSSDNQGQQLAGLIPEDNNNGGGRGQQWHLQHASFTQLQLQELEDYFQVNRNPSRPVREEFARRMGMPEARVEVWFKNRRVRWRRYQRAQRIRNARRVCVSRPIPNISRAPYDPVHMMRPNGIWLSLQPMLVWPLGPPLLLMPMLPMPPMLVFPHLLVPLPLLLFPVPPFRLVLVSLVWLPALNILFVVRTYWY